jgi:hypothetical protein
VFALVVDEMPHVVIVVIFWTTTLLRNDVCVAFLVLLNNGPTKFMIQCYLVVSSDFSVADYLIQDMLIELGI